MDSTGLRRFAGRARLPLGTVEKDQAITLALGFLAQQSFAGRMVFKGGTALGKCYFEAYRFSEDLDFTLSSDVADELLASAQRLVRAGRSVGVHFTGMTREPSGKGSRLVRLRYRDMNNHPNSIRVEMSLREKVLLDPPVRPIRDPYGVLGGPVTIPTMALPEILAEKVRALHMRRKARDLYDVWSLVSRGVRFENALAEAKLGWWMTGMRFDARQAAARVRDLEGIWQRDMPQLVSDFPPFATAAKVVLKALGD